MANKTSSTFGNRILWVCCWLSKELPYGGNPVDAAKKQALVRKLQGVLETARSIGQVTFDEEAYKAWAPLYHQLVKDCDGLVGSMTARAAPLVIRLATLYALLDETSKISLKHLTAANEVWGYCEDSVIFLFGDALGDETAIRRLLNDAPDGLTRTEINRAFGSHKTSAELDRALENLAKLEKEDTGGAITRWRSTHA